MEVVTNDKVKSRKGGAAYLVYCCATPGTIRAVLPISRPYRHTTLYHTETYAILDTLLAIHHLLRQQQHTNNLTGVIWCDNSAAVNKFNKLNGKVPFSITDANQSDSDVIQELSH